MLIDTHSHLNFAAFDKDRADIIKKCLENNIQMINIGTNFETSKKAVEIAEKCSFGVYAAIGLHPIDLDTGLIKMKKDVNELGEGHFFEKEFDYQKYKGLAISSRVVAIGEIGLDYYWRPKTTRKKRLFKQKQKELLLTQIDLAKELNLPVIFHCRVAHDDLIKVLVEPRILNSGQLRGVMHGFVGNTEQLQEYLKMGFYIGFNGIIFKNIKGIDFEKNIEKTPLDKILIETDCPYLTPLQKEGERNEPAYIKYVAEKIAQIRKITPEVVAEITAKNARKLFGL